MGTATPNILHVELDVTTPANTAKASPQTTTWTKVVGNLNSIELVVPTGHAGNTGISIQANGVNYLPWGNATLWLVADNLQRVFPMQFVWYYDLKVLTYNTDLFPHTHYLRAEVDISAQSQQVASSVSSAQVPIAAGP